MESRAKFKNENKMAVADRAAVVSLIEELSDIQYHKKREVVKMKNFYSFF